MSRPPRIGSLCTGYGGLDMAVEAVIPDAELAWVSDIDKGSCKVLAHRYPDVPNLGDFTKTDWWTVEPVDILTAGYPCQPFSHAGNRKGANDERHLWPAVREAIRGLRPRVTLLENVAGHRSLGFDRVLGDLAEDGMHVQWTSIRAADVGAPHGRERLFILVTNPKHAQLERVGQLSGLWGRPDSRAHVRVSDRLALLPTPAAHEPGGSLEQYHARLAAHDGRESTFAPLSMAVQLLGESQDRGDYAPAIARWEALTRPAPAPMQPSKKGTPQLSAAFSEWMMGLPAGWVTDVPGITRNEALKLCGNGVVPQQAEAALRVLLDRIEVAA